MSRHIVRMAMGGVLTLAFLAGAAPAANASPVPEAAAPVAAAAQCKGHPVRPVKVGSSIRIATTFSHCSGTAFLKLQRQRFPGWWDTVKRVGVPASGRRTLTVSCRGSGTRTYRTQVTGGIAGNLHNWTSTTYRVHC